MKKLNITEGSLMPFWMKDLEYMQTGFEEVVRGIIKGLSLEDKNIIISGCKITNTGSSISMTAGWCYYEGEILRVEALPTTECSAANPMIVLKESVVSDERGRRHVTLNGEVSSSDIYEEKILKPELPPIGINNLYYNLGIAPGAWDLGERLMYSSKVSDSGEKKIDTNLYVGICYYRKIGGTVQLYGNITNNALGVGINGNVASGLPQPARDIIRGDITIDKRGQLIISSNSDSVSLEGIIYLSTPEYPTNDGHYCKKPNSDVV